MGKAVQAIEGEQGKVKGTVREELHVARIALI